MRIDQEGMITMKTPAEQTALFLACAATAALLTGCAGIQASNRPVDISRPHHMDAKFDASDMRGVTSALVGKFTDSAFLAKQAEPPLMIIAGVQNRTHDHVDTKNITDRIRTLLLQAGSVRFINEDRRADLLQEQGYQAAHARPDQQVEIGRQLGAKYMFSGSLTEMKSKSPQQIRVSKQEIRDYKFTLEVTDLESGEIVWIEHSEFARQASKPLIGW